jgi:hypothetical protein
MNAVRGLGIVNKRINTLLGGNQPMFLQSSITTYTVYTETALMDPIRRLVDCSKEYKGISLKEVISLKCTLFLHSF